MHRIFRKACDSLHYDLRVDRFLHRFHTEEYFQIIEIQNNAIKLTQNGIDAVSREIGAIQFI